MKGRARILVADDELVMRDLLTSFLTDDGYEVIASTNGAEALEKLKEKHFDLLITDVHMPVMNGLELLHQVSRLDPSLVVVMLDSYPDQLLFQAEAEGARASLHKPFDISELRQLLKELLPKSQVPPVPPERRSEQGRRSPA